jgi:hypothetical protein
MEDFRKQKAEEMQYKKDEQHLYEIKDYLPPNFFKGPKDKFSEIYS